MGLFENIFSKKDVNAVYKANEYFQTLTAYSPVFTSWNGKLYESELVRSAIDARARHNSKLKVEAIGTARPLLRKYLQTAPNSFQTWSQFLYRLSTILDMQNNAFIVPLHDEYGSITGYYSLLPSMCELVSFKGIAYIRYTFRNGQKAAVPLSECGVMTKFQYKDDYFGESNGALNGTMSLIDIQQQGIKEAVKSSATYRFMAQLSNFAKDSDLVKERKRFTQENFSEEAKGGGMLLFPNNYQNIQQIKTSPYTIDAEQMKAIQTNVFNYFGVNEKILQNSATGDEMDAFFNGAIEPFSIQLSEVLTRMTYTSREQNTGSKIMATANRLQYMTVKTKILMAQQLGDRGFITINEIRELFNYPLLPPEEGNMRPIRGEFKDATDTSEEGEKDDLRGED